MLDSFSIIKNDILGKEYSLSIAYVSERKSRELNRKYRGKNKATNILSFPLKKEMGEIVLCRAVIRREAKNFGKTSSQFAGLLVIHGMLHLKGLAHSSRMERAEKKYEQKYFSGHRSRIVHDASRGRGISKRRKKS
jgi:probable rRNA maturation factor